MSGSGNPAALIAAAKAAQESAARAELETDLNEALARLGRDEDDFTSRFFAVRCLEKLRRQEDATALLAAGIRPGCPPLMHLKYIGALEQCNRTEEAIAQARIAQREFADQMIFRFLEQLILPVLYTSTAEVDRWRARYAEGLDRLCAETSLDSPEDRRAALGALKDYSSNVFLAYQGHNDRDLQMQWGQFLHRIMAANYPRWAISLPAQPVRPGEPLRIGYVSSRFNDSSATRFFLGWLRERDTSRIDVHGWHVGLQSDSVTEEVQRICTRFDWFPDGFENTCLSIRERSLHALIFLDIGIEPLMNQLAAMRLAPVQCMAWDHPVTSGLPTIDFALSPELSEPPGAESHYSERLLRLPGVGVCFQRPVIPTPILSKTRRDFGLAESDVVYLCCQSIFKFLPASDEVFVQIASQVSSARFVFTSPNESLTQVLLTRLRGAFFSAGLKADEHCIVLPHLNHFDYWNLHLVGDVFLDTIGWSSAGSVFEAIACRVPVVTLAGNLMRARQGAAILTQLGVTETIAPDAVRYADIAVRLGRERTWREELRRKTEQGWPELFSDRRSAEALDRILFDLSCSGTTVV